MRNHNTSIMEVRATLPLAGGVKCRQPERVEDGGNRSVAKSQKTHNPNDTSDTVKPSDMGPGRFGKTGQTKEK